MMVDGPRERLARLGESALSDAELVALHLGTGHRGEPVLVLAHRLLHAWGGVSGLARADVAELSRTPGIGRAKAGRLVAAFALASRVDRNRSTSVRSSADLATLAKGRLGVHRHEHVLGVVLNARHDVVHDEIVASGGSTGAQLPVRELVALALRHDGVALAVAHNHPSGNAAPSAADLDGTRRLMDACATVGVRLLDHVVVTDGAAWSSIRSAL
ncbi:RadC family protein [Dermacoccus abyssi]